MMTTPGQAPVLSTGASAFGVIDEVARSNADYFESGDAQHGVVAVETNNPTAPVSDRNHFLRVAVGKNSSGGETLACIVEVRQGYSAETVAGLGTLITAISVPTPDSMTTYVRRLTTTEAALITDYTDIQLRFILSRVGGSGGARRTQVYWAEFEVPSVGVPEVDTLLSQEELRLRAIGQPIDGKVESH
jgi:hypothetical protein